VAPVKSTDVEMGFSGTHFVSRELQNTSFWLCPFRG
jgi:hypothetical protein